MLKQTTLSTNINVELKTAVAASICGQQLFKPGYAVPRLGEWNKAVTPIIKGQQCAAIDELNLHAASWVGADNHRGLEKLISYITRPAISVER